VSRLLVRDLAQLATPAGTAAPLRGAELGTVEVVEEAYVLVEDGRIAATGRMRISSRSTATSRARRPRAVRDPGLVDCHTHACFGGDRVDEFSLRAAGATYEELHAAAAGSSPPSGQLARPGRKGSPRRCAATAAGCSARHDGPSRPSRATGSTATPSSRSSGDPGRRRGSRPGSAPTRSRPSSRTPTRTSTSRSPKCSPRRPRSPRQPTSSSSECVRRDAGPPIPHRLPDAGLALRLHGDQFTEHGAIPLALELGARSVDHLEATGPAGVAALAAGEVTGVLLP